MGEDVPTAWSAAGGSTGEQSETRRVLRIGGEACFGLGAPRQMRPSENRWVGRELWSKDSQMCPGDSRLGEREPAGAQGSAVWKVDWGPGGRHNTNGEGMTRLKSGKEPPCPHIRVKGRRQGESMMRQRCLPGDAGTETGTVHAHQELSAHREPSHFLPTPFPKNLHLFKMSLGCSLVPCLSSTARWHGAVGWAAPMGLSHPPTNFPEQAP